LLKTFHIKGFLIAQDDITIGFTSDTLVSELQQISDGEVWKSLVDTLVDIIVDTLLLSYNPCVDERVLRGAHTSQTFGDRLLGNP